MHMIVISDCVINHMLRERCVNDTRIKGNCFKIHEQIFWFISFFFFMHKIFTIKVLPTTDRQHFAPFPRRLCEIPTIYQIKFTARTKGLLGGGAEYENMTTAG